MTGRRRTPCDARSSVTRLDEGLQANHVVLGGHLQGAVYLAPVVGVVSVGEQKVPVLVRGPRGRGALTCKCSSGLSG